MSEQSTTLPFETYMFSLADGPHGSVSIKLVARDDSLFDCEVIHRAGSAKTSKTSQVTLEDARALIARLTDIGVFRWDSSYGDSDTQPPCKWRMNVVFKQGVFEFASQGGSDTPPHFPDVLEALYAVGLPSPRELERERASKQTGAGSAASGFAGMPGASPFGGAGNPEDFARFAQSLGLPPSMMPSAGDMQQMQQAFNEFLQNPAHFQGMMRAEFATLTYEQQEQLLSTLAMLTGESREWWSNFLRG